MKINSLLDQYELSLKTTSISMPLGAIIFIVGGIIACIKYSQIFWVGIILGVLGVIEIVMFVFIRRYLLKKIAELKQQEQNNGD